MVLIFRWHCGCWNSKTRKAKSNCNQQHQQQRKLHNWFFTCFSCVRRSTENSGGETNLSLQLTAISTPTSATITKITTWLTTPTAAQQQQEQWEYFQCPAFSHFQWCEMKLFNYSSSRMTAAAGATASTTRTADNIADSAMLRNESEEQMLPRAEISTRTKGNADWMISLRVMLLCFPLPSTTNTILFYYKSLGRECFNRIWEGNYQKWIT